MKASGIADPLPRLSAAKLEGITLAVTRYLRQLEGDQWRDEATSPGGWDVVHAELVGAVPTVER
jgi:hypothetical protein